MTTNLEIKYVREDIYDVACGRIEKLEAKLTQTEADLETHMEMCAAQQAINVADRAEADFYRPEAIDVLKSINEAQRGIRSVLGELLSEVKAIRRQVEHGK